MVTRRRWLMRGVLPLVFMVAVTVGWTPTAAQPDPMGPVAPVGQPLDQLSGEAFDQAFLRELIMHHAMAVMMAQPVVANGQRQELRDLAAMIIADQTREITQMRAWLMEWYDFDVPNPLDMMSGMPGDGEHGGMTGSKDQGMPLSGGQGGRMGGMQDAGMTMMADLWRLPPARLDAVFMSLMVVHHDGAIEMAQLALDRAAREEVKGLAEGVIAAQSAEKAQMTVWLAAWYGL